jgi:transcriptional regulator with GAF, ATPase, and Fis domain
MTSPPTTARPPAEETFVSGDGCQRGLWVVTSPDSEQVGRCLLLDDGEELLLGRGEGRGCFDDPWMSQRHATVRALGCGATQRLKVEDHGATNGVRLIRGAGSLAELLPGAALRCGATVLLYDDGSAPSDAMGIVGCSAELAALRDDIALHAPQRYPVHVRGETGVGKELVARALHAGDHRTGQFISLNVAAVPANLAEAELFGTVPGAFTGARQRAGLMVEAHDGTLLLDEIGELPLAIQAKLLRVLDDYVIRPLGSNETQAVSVRLVTATHRDLEDLVEQQAFRQDLFWRLAMPTLEVPPLRERPLDIVPLFAHFYGQRGGPDLQALCHGSQQCCWALADLFTALLAYDWPGNARELQREAELVAAKITTRQQADHPRPIPPPAKCLDTRVLEGAQASSSDGDSAERPTPEVRPLEIDRLRAAFESRELLLVELEAQTGGNKRAFAQLAAHALGVKEATARRNIYRLLGRQDGALDGAVDGADSGAERGPGAR